jgi:hypothetical protein
VRVLRRTHLAMTATIAPIASSPTFSASHTTISRGWNCPPLLVSGVDARLVSELEELPEEILEQRGLRYGTDRDHEVRHVRSMRRATAVATGLGLGEGLLLGALSPFREEDWDI